MATSESEIVSNPYWPIRWPDPETGPWHITGHWAEIDGLPACIGIEIWKNTEPIRDSYIKPRYSGSPSGKRCRPLPGRAPEGLSATDLRTIRLAAVLRQLWARQREAEVAEHAGVSRALERIKDSPDPYHHMSHDDRVAALQAVLEEPTHFQGERKRKSSDDREHFAVVALVYGDAFASHRSPTKAVKEHFDVSHSTAAKWVARARQLGFLGPTRAGVPGGLGGAPSAPPTRPRKAKK